MDFFKNNNESKLVQQIMHHLKTYSCTMAFTSHTYKNHASHDSLISIYIKSCSYSKEIMFPNIIQSQSRLSKSRVYTNSWELRRRDS